MILTFMKYLATPIGWSPAGDDYIRACPYKGISRSTLEGTPPTSCVPPWALCSQTHPHPHSPETTLQARTEIRKHSYEREKGWGQAKRHGPLPGNRLLQSNLHMSQWEWFTWFFIRYAYSPASYYKNGKEWAKKISSEWQFWWRQSSETGLWSSRIQQILS